MPLVAETLSRLAEIPDIRIDREIPLARFTRFALGGPADLLIDAPTETSFIAAADAIRASGTPLTVIGGGTNLVVADAGVRGAVLRFTGNRIGAAGNIASAESGAILQDLVDFTIERGLAGIHTMTGVPGWVGGAVYGNAGAYGNSLHCVVQRVRFWDGTTVRAFGNAECRFDYRESIFKKRKDWVIFSTDLRMPAGAPAEMRRQADEILAIRNAKYPPDMKCAGSIFKNVFLAKLPESAQREVPERMVRDGKVPSAWFLEQVGAKGIRNGDIHVADYHANLIYNAGRGTALQVREVIDDLKERVRSRFRFDLEEEVQYVGFS
ncbi:MAG TPA: UDP-N-acetylmuramate dehydrogenase [Bryobacteraceae bacterium]|nr:UDP-N-acetylmuramate dehydrogenase [Bryobacteraceae bacterium]